MDTLQIEIEREYDQNIDIHLFEVQKLKWEKHYLGRIYWRVRLCVTFLKGDQHKQCIGALVRVPA